MPCAVAVIVTTLLVLLAVELATRDANRIPTPAGHPGNWVDKNGTLP